MMFMKDFGFKIIVKDKKTNARLGIIHTPHGDIQTPAFVPVGTQATVKSLTSEDLEKLGINLFFVNTYHAYLRPGLQVIQAAGGLHKFMNWTRPLITDSGGFQIFSLGSKRFARKKEDENRETELVKITDDGVTFKSHWDGSTHIFTPEKAMEFQHKLGSDIHIAFDDCTPYPVNLETAEKSMKRTHQWAERSFKAHQKFKLNEPYGCYQALYGSIQGSVYPKLRRKSAEFISGLDFDGIAIGGVSVGESKKEMQDVLDWVCPYLPPDKPRHLLGVGEFDDIFLLIEHGIDTFDCVQPTRLARMGILYSKDRSNKNPDYTLDIQKAEYAEDFKPIDTACSCDVCHNYTRAYIHHLFKVRELTGYKIATFHNLAFICNLVWDIRQAIQNSKFLELKKNWLYDR
jgi:queuine tRNA-ribosyltransferase